MIFPYQLFVFSCPTFSTKHLFRRMHRFLYKSWNDYLQEPIQQHCAEINDISYAMWELVYIKDGRWTLIKLILQKNNLRTPDGDRTRNLSYRWTCWAFIFHPLCWNHWIQYHYSLLKRIVEEILHRTIRRTFPSLAHQLGTVSFFYSLFR